MGSPDIAALFLDIGGVLLSNGWDRRSRRQAADTFALDYDEMDERHHLAFSAYEEGRMSLEDYLDLVVFHRGRPFSRAQFRDFMLAQSYAYPDMIDLVRRTKAAHRLKIAVVSNEGRELNVHRVEKFSLGSFVDCFVSSSFVHLRKPDPAIFRLALDIVQVRPSQVAYIEDRDVFVEAARRLGIRGILHTGCASTQAALAGLGLSLPAPESGMPPESPPEVTA